MSGRDVKQVTDVAREIANVGKRARAVADDLKTSIGEVGDALDVAEELSRALRHAGAELRGVLGTQTNNPPEGAGKGEDEK